MSEVTAVPSIPFLGVTPDGKVMNMISHKWLSICDNGHGYKQVFISVQNKRYVRYVHRLVAECFIPNPENLREVNHKDGNKWNNNVENLEWCTTSQNHRHAYETGLRIPSDVQKEVARINGKKSVKKMIEGAKRWRANNPEYSAQCSRNNIAKVNKLRHENSMKLTDEERKSKDRERYRRYRMNNLEAVRERDRKRRKEYRESHREEINLKARQKYACLTAEQKKEINSKHREWYSNKKRRNDLSTELS